MIFMSGLVFSKTVGATAGLLGEETGAQPSP
jgi:hypothetical protein